MLQGESGGESHLCSFDESLNAASGCQRWTIPGERNNARGSQKRAGQLSESDITASQLRRESADAMGQYAGQIWREAPSSELPVSMPRQLAIGHKLLMAQTSQIGRGIPP